MTHRKISSMLVTFIIMASILSMGFDAHALTTYSAKYSNASEVVSASYTTNSPSYSTTATSATSFRILKFTKIVKRGANAKVSIKTTPKATCFLSYRTPHGTQSVARGLGKKIANGSGVCTWKWKISPGTIPGTGYVYIAVNGVGSNYPIAIK